MGYDLYIDGVKPISDKKIQRMLNVRTVCRESGVKEPEEVTKILGEEPDGKCPRGEIVNIETDDVTENGNPVQYIDITKLPFGTKYIRLFHSY